MISEELLKNVQKLEINTRRIVQSTFSGKQALVFPTLQGLCTCFE